MAVKINVTINGKEYYRIRKTVGKDKDGNDKLKPFYGTSKKDAEKKRDDWIHDSSLGLKISDKQSLTMAVYIWLWNIERVSGNKGNSFSRYEGIYRNYVDDSDLGYLILSEIEKLTIQKHYTKMFENGKTYSQIKNMNKLLSKFFIYCLEERYLLSNPCKGVKFNAYKNENDIDFEDGIELDDEGKVETFSDDEINSIVNFIRNEKLRIMSKLALATGLRQGEILALRIPDIKDMTVFVTKTLSNVKIFDEPEKYHYEYIITRPKTKKSRRKVPIPIKLKNDLIELNKIKNIERLKLGELYQENDLLFPSSTGTFINSCNLLRSWERALNNIGVPYKKFHSLRHTYATQLIKNGTELITVSRLLGHASVKTTEIYAHVMESTKQEEVQSLNNLF